MKLQTILFNMFGIINSYKLFALEKAQVANLFKQIMFKSNQFQWSIITYTLAYYTFVFNKNNIDTNIFYYIKVVFYYQLIKNYNELFSFHNVFRNFTSMEIIIIIIYKQIFNNIVLIKIMF